MKNIIRHIITASLFVVPFFPFAVISSSTYPFVTGEAFFFRTCIEIAFGLWIILALTDKKYRPKFTPISISIFIYGIVALIADIFGTNFSLSFWSNFDRMDGWITTAHLMMFYIAAVGMFGSTDAEKIWKRWLNMSLVIAALVGLYGFFQILGMAQMHFDNVRIDAVFGNPTFFAAYLLFHVFFAVYLLVDAWRQKNFSRPIVWAYIFALVLFLVDIYKTGTRGTILGLLIGLIVALTLIFFIGLDVPKKWRRVSIGIVAFVIIAGSLFWIFRNNPYIRNNPILGRFASISWTASDQSRQYIWPAAIKGISEKPILGWGQDNFLFAFQKYYNPAMYNMEQWVDRAHNIFLDQLIGLGIVGLLSYMAIFVVSMVMLWRSRVSISKKSLISGLLLGYLVHDFFVFDTLSSYVFLFATLALVDSQTKGNVTLSLNQWAVSETAMKFVTLPCAVIVICITIYFVNVRPLWANIYLAQASNLCSDTQTNTDLFEETLSLSSYLGRSTVFQQLIPCTENVISNPRESPKIKQSFIDLTSGEIDEQIKNSPDDAYMYYISGQFMKNIGQLTRAQEFLIKAHLLAPNEQIVDFELASIYLMERRTQDAVDVLRQAYESAPSYGKASTVYALALIMNKQASDAELIPNADPYTLKIASTLSPIDQFPALFALLDNLTAPEEVINVLIQQARIQYAAGNIDQAINILRGIEAGNPQDRIAIEAAISEAQNARISQPKQIQP